MSLEICPDRWEILPNNQLFLSYFASNAYTQDTFEVVTPTLYRYVKSTPDYLIAKSSQADFLLFPANQGTTSKTIKNFNLLKAELKHTSPFLAEIEFPEPFSDKILYYIPIVFVILALLLIFMP